MKETSQVNFEIKAIKMKAQMRTFSEVLVKWNFQQGTLILVYITIPESF